MTNDKTNENKIARQTFTGVVVSNKMNNTVMVEVKSHIKHQKYNKFQIKKTKFMADDPGNTKKIGDTVKIEACRPLSKNKFFRVVTV
jgi:small subunit ribosomal protein S17